MNGATYVYVYAPAPGGGGLLNMASGNFYMHKDWLGNARIVSSVPSTGNGSVSTDRAYAPYGEIYDIFGSTAQNEAMFTGDTQDILAGMYDTPNRELQGSQQGRWLSPDPARSGWNQYAYATNPNSFVDPSGLNMCATAAGHCDLGDTGVGGNGAPGDIFSGFCDASSECSGGFGEGSFCTGGQCVSWGFGPGYNMQATSPSSQLEAAVSRYLSIISNGWDPALGINWNNLYLPQYLAQANGQYNRLSGNLLADFGTDASADPTTCDLEGGHCNFALNCDPDNCRTRGATLTVSTSSAPRGAMTVALLTR
jgi:RHS repeat-associated protein